MTNRKVEKYTTREYYYREGLEKNIAKIYVPDVPKKDHERSKK